MIARRVYGEPGTLYARCGGVFGVSAFVDRCMDKWMAYKTLNSNAMVARWHQSAQRPGFKFLVVQIVCSLTGGPQAYTGRPMDEAHMHLGISTAEWRRFIAIAHETFEVHKVPAAARRELIEIIEGFEHQCVLPPGRAAPPDPGMPRAHPSTLGTAYHRLGGVYPIADLKQLEGLKAGARNPISMFDGYNFIGAKAYKDSKLCLMMLSNMLHDKYHKQTGIAFSSIYPGCIAESPLFREKRAWFRKYFPIFMKYITGGFVGEEEAGMRLFQVAHDPRCSKSGVYWSWNGGPREGRDGLRVAAHARLVDRPVDRLDHVF